MSVRRWHPEQVAWLRDAYRLHRVKALVPLFAAQFGAPVTEQAIRSAIRAHRLTSGRRPGLVSGERAVSWFPDRIEFLRQHRPTMPLKALTAAFNAHFGTAFQLHSISNALLRHEIKGASDGRFPPGLVPWNKGKAGYQPGGRSPETRFRKGQLIWHQMPVGAYKQDPDGYWWLKFQQASPPNLSRRDWIPLHRLHWQDRHGPIPPGCCIIVLDGRTDHPEIDNLACLTRRELVVFNCLLANVPPDREARRALVARVKLRVAASKGAEKLGLSVSQRQAMLGVLPRLWRQEARV